MKRLSIVPTSFLQNVTYLGNNDPLNISNSKEAPRAQTEIMHKIRLSKTRSYKSRMTKREDKEDFIAQSKQKFYDPNIEMMNNNIQNMLNQGIGQYNSIDISKNDNNSLIISPMARKGMRHLSFNTEMQNHCDKEKEKDMPNIMKQNSVNRPTILSRNFLNIDRNERRRSEKDSSIKMMIGENNIRSSFNNTNTNNNDNNDLFVEEDDEDNQEDIGKDDNDNNEDDDDNEQYKQKSKKKTSSKLKTYKTVRAVNKLLAKKRQMISLPNVYDSFCEEEREMNDVVDPQFVLYPDSKLILIWNIIIALLVVYSITFSPYILAFNIEGLGYEIIDIISDLIFLIDVVLQFFIAYYDDNEDVLVVSKSQIACHYLKTFFIFDLCSSIPFSIVAISIVAEEDALDNHKGSISKRISSFQKISKITKFYRILKWTRLLKILKFSNKSRKDQSNSMKEFTKSKAGQIIKFLMMLLLIIHLSASIWIFIGRTIMNDNASDYNWLTKYNIHDEDNGYIYLASIYFIINSMLTHGYGDITATSSAERLFIIFFMMVGCMIYSLMLTALSSIFSQIDSRTMIFTKKEFMLEQIRKDYNIPLSLYESIKKTLHHDFIKWKDDQLKLLDSLPGSLKNNLYLKMHENQIKHLKFFKNQSYDFILFAVPHLKSVRFSREDLLTTVGSVMEEMYLIIRGMLSIRLGYKYENYELGILKYGDHFGDILMYLNDQCHYEVKIKSKYAELFTLNKSNFATIKLNYRQATDDILKKSYGVFLKLEDKRKMSLKYYHKYRHFEGFKKFYMKEKNKEGEFCDGIMDTSEEDTYSQFRSSKHTNTNTTYTNTNNIDDIFAMKKKMNLVIGKEEESSISSIYSRSYSKSNTTMSKGQGCGGTFIMPSSGLSLGLGFGGNHPGALDDKKTISNLFNLQTANSNNSYEKKTSATINDRYRSDSESLGKRTTNPDQLNPFLSKSNNMIYINNININYTNNNLNDNLNHAKTSLAKTNIIPAKSMMTYHRPPMPINTMSSLGNNNKLVNRRMSYSRMSSFDNRSNAICGSLLKLRKERNTNAKITGNIKRTSIYNKDNFLQRLNEKIENNAMMENNQVLLEDYILDFLNAKEGESNIKKMLHKLKRIEKDIISHEDDDID